MGWALIYREHSIDDWTMPAISLPKIQAKFKATRCPATGKTRETTGIDVQQTEHNVRLDKVLR